MDADRTISLGGAYGSPYSLKMRVVLRYRHIPFRWVLRGSCWDDLPAVPVRIIPVISIPGVADGEAETMVDSSPQILRLEQAFAGRSILPPDPALAFIDLLLEDYADEWVTKMMYHYRWAYLPDATKAGRLLPLDQDLHASDDDLARMSQAIVERQVSRRALVGSTEPNRAIIEGSYQRLLVLLEAHLRAHPFLLGERPGRADFALYGQLKPLLWWDPTPMALAVDLAPRAMNWIDRVDDLSWWDVEGERGWADADALPTTVRVLLAEAGDTYAPFLLANAAALEADAEEVVCEIRGLEYRQAPFKYQAKCLHWLRTEYAALAHDARTTVDSVLEATGCANLFT